MAEIAQGINVDLKIMGGAPVVAGTRVPVDLVLDQLGCGMTAEEVATEYRLTKEQVLACIRFARSEISETVYRAA